MSIYKDFDTGVGDSVLPIKNASNRQLVDRQLKLIRPLLARSDTDYLRSVEALLMVGLGNRKV